MSRFTRWFDRAQFPSRSARRRRQRKADLRLRPLRLESLEERRLLSLTTDSFSGGVLTVDFNAADRVGITSSGGNVLVNGSSPTTGAAAVGSVTAIDITGTGNFDNTIDLSGVSAAQGFSNLATVTIAAGGAVNGDTILLGPLNASGAVNVSSVGPSQITLAAGVAAGSLVIAPGILSDIYLDGGVTTSGAQDYAAPAWIEADAVLSAGNGNITFGSTLDGAHNVTLDSSGATTFAGVVGGADSLSSLTTDAAGSTVIDASITTSGSGGLTLNDPVTLGGDVTLSAGFNPVTIASTIDGDYALAIDSSDLALNGAIGSSEPLASLSTNISFNATFRGGSITTIGYQWYDNDIMLAADATFDAGKSTLLFQSGLDGAYAATLKSAGLIELTGSVGSRTPLADLTTDGTGTTSIGEDVNSTGNQTYNNAVSVESYSALIAGTGNITFNGPIEGGGLETSTKGTTTFNSPVGTSAILASLTTDAGGTTVLNAGSIDTNSAVTFNNNVVLPVNTSIDASSTQFAGAIDGPGSLSTEAGNTTFAGAIGGTTPLNALNVVASFTTLSADTTINVGSGGVTFGFVNGAHALAITSAGLASLTAAIGNSSPPTTLSVVAAGPITLYGDITTSGNQVYSHPATIGSGTILTSTGGTISYASTAPFLTSTAPTLPGVSTNEAASTTETVSTLIGGLIVDNNDSYGIAINGQTTPGGAWQYSLDGSTWGNFGAVGATQSLLLAPADFVRFVPDGVDTGTATFSYRAWDQSTGAAGTVVDTTANGGNTAFSVASATALIAVQIPSVLTSETFSDGVLTIGLDGPQNVAIASGAGELLVNGASPNAGAVLASAVTAIDITGTAGTYDNTIDLSGVSAAQGFSSLDTVSIDAGGSLAGDQILLGALNASGLVSITGTGIATVTAASGSVVAGSVSVTTEALKLTSAITITTTGDQLYNSDISIASGVNVSTSNGDITFNGTVNGYGLLTVSSPQLTAFNATVGGAVPLSGLTVDSGGRTVLAASVTAATLDLFSPVTLSANLTLGSATFDIANTIDGAYALTIDTSSPLSIAAALGSITPLASLTIIAASTNFNGGEVTTTGSQTYDTAFVLQSDATFNAGSSPILFDSSLDGAHNAVFDTSATTTLVGNLGAKTALASLTTDGGGTTAIEGDLTTTGKQTYNGQVTAGTSTVLNAGSAGIVFNGSIDGGILMCNSIGTTWFNAPIGTTSLLGSLTVEGGGTTILAGRYLETTSGMTFYDPVVLASDMTVSSDSFVGFDSTVDGTYNLNLDQSPAYYAAFIGAVGSSTPLASLTVSGDTVSFGNVATLGDVTTIGSQLYLASTVDLDGLYDSTGSSIHIIGAAMVDGNSAIDAAGVVTVDTVNGPSSLNIVSGGLVTFDGEVGNTPLKTLTVSSPSGIDVNANVTTTGNQIYSLPVNVATGVSLTSETGSVSKVASVSTAPVLTSIAPTMNPTVVNADSYPEEDVGDLIGSSTTDDNDVYNIAVESVSTSGGTWQYSSDDAKTWTDFGTVSATKSLVLLSSDIVRFLAGAEVGTATFTYRATDQAGVGGELVDTTTNGGNSAFSAATDTTSVVVQIAPVITTDTFSGGVLTVDVDGPENVSIGSSGGRLLIDGNNPTTGVALASAVTVIDITASAGQYDNSITLTGVSAAQGFTSLASVSVNTGGSYFADHVTLGTLNASGLVSITGARSDSVSVPGTLVAGSLSITATALSLGSVTTTGNQTYNAPVRLSNAATLSAGSGNVTFNNTVDGSYSLTINSSGATTFAGTVGGHAEPTSLTTDSAGSTVIGASLAVIDNININDPLTLAGNVTLDGGLAANGYSTAVNIKSTIDGPYALVIDSRNMSLVGAIGSTTPLASLVVGATSSAVFGSMDTLSGGSITTTGPQTINVDLRLSANTTFSAGSSTILVQGGLLGDSATFNTAGLTDLTPGIFMGIQVNSVTTDAAGTTTIS
ncbi:MAG TPA: hypothetical protein VHV55_18945, partial [Pirellulales bacterium]|nr:hypothetical protein [Pirellulales bacterium]